MNSFFQRKFIIQSIILTAVFLLIARLFYIQIIDDRYLDFANNNVLRRLVVYPPRGVIYDRNNTILVQNEPVYDLMVVPKSIKQFDTLLLCQLIEVEKEKFIGKLKKAREFSPVKASLLEKQLSSETYARLQEHLFQFPGFFVQNRTLRKYPEPIAAHVLGYIGEVNDRIIELSKGDYRQGDYIGISGIERSYEQLLRGQRGIKRVMVDVFNREQGSFDEGKYDTAAVPGDRMITSLDAKLQKYGEDLMKNKLGSIVAIEPSTGEILAFVSAPNYDPNLLVGRVRGNNYMKLLKDPLKPLFIRPIQAQYPPGSTFKAIQALIGQQMGLITPEQRFPCGGGYRAGGHFVKCEHNHSPQNMVESIQNSCNAYYCWAFKTMIDNHPGMTSEDAYTAWRDAIAKFGIGTKLEIDLPNELKGLLPTHKYYDKIYGANHWKSSTVISLAIGQGELGITPLQMANVMAAIANRGYYYRPHLVKAIGDKKHIRPEFSEKNYVGIDQRYFPPVIDGMERVILAGTATNARIADISICGKTGTAQNPHGKNHSVFMGFAPKDNPKIAIAVMVENAGYGATWAAPIASLMIEKYVRDSITRPKYYEDRILNASLLPGDEFNASGNIKKKEDTPKGATIKTKDGKPTTSDTKKTGITAQPSKEEKLETIKKEKAQR
ncbi:penicillin-binding protein 2 [Solitalea lacus]|uniref:penicillin-binding protein 2 n=1 Tax=Solitalea lacus TaxID=2911172 RepID=UPI001EDB1383|nr:penicillin-binding protein 2 [Solitalea lacus]UKJ08679.1 penicillin-binding protein 2 [Solitalea lacus]